MQEFNYTCPKCRNTECDVGEFRATGGFLSKIFDIQSKRFTTSGSLAKGLPYVWLKSISSPVL